MSCRRTSTLEKVSTSVNFVQKKVGILGQTSLRNLRSTWWKDTVTLLKLVLPQLLTSQGCTKLRMTRPCFYSKRLKNQQKQSTIIFFILSINIHLPLFFIIIKKNLNFSQNNQTPLTVRFSQIPSKSWWSTRISTPLRGCCPRRPSRSCSPCSWWQGTRS